MKKSQRVHVLLFPHTHLLDLSGTVQVFFEANAFGGRYELRYCSEHPEVVTAQGLRLAGLAPLSRVAAEDLVFIPGTESRELDGLQIPAEWLREAAAAGARLASVCTGAFTLARAGLLDGRQCTTHWKVAERLEREHPAARVLRQRLFVHYGPVSTSAGVTSGIDLALALVEEAHGPIAAARVAREIVVYVRRNGERAQQSVYLDFRTHLHPGVHRVQDRIAMHPEERPTLEGLAALAGLSPRHLIRRFRELTGITLKEYAHRLKLELAEGLLRDPTMSVEAVAHRCGFEDPRQLRRLFRRAHGSTPGVWRRAV